MRQINALCLHCTASPQSQRVEDILHYWKHDLGWELPGYHFLIKPDGEAVNILPISKVSNGVKGHNANTIHISYIGGIVTKGAVIDGVEHSKGQPIDNRTSEQKQTQLELLVKFNQQFPTAIILGHRDFSPDKNRNGIIEPSEWLKTCPSFSVKDWLKEVKFKTAFPLTIKKTKTGLNIREGAGVEFIKKGLLSPGTDVKLLAEFGGWNYVEVQTGTLKDVLGWVSSEFIA